MNYTPFIISLGIGAAVGLLLGAFGTRTKRHLLMYMLAGMLGAGLFSALPFLRGNEYFAMNPKFTAGAAAVLTGLAILFSPAKTR